MMRSAPFVLRRPDRRAELEAVPARIAAGLLFDELDPDLRGRVGMKMTYNPAFNNRIEQAWRTGRPLRRRRLERREQGPRGI